MSLTVWPDGTAPYTQEQWPWANQTVTVSSPSLPVWCIGDVHVWGCPYAMDCKCGKATRTPLPPPKCPHCGKEHA